MLKYAGVHTYPQVTVLTERPEKVQHSTFPKAAHAQAVRGEPMSVPWDEPNHHTKRKGVRNNGQKPRTAQYDRRKARR